MLEHPARQPAEVMRIALVGHGESSNRDAVDLLDAGRSLVPPRDVVAGACRDDLHLCVPRKPLCHVPRMEFRAAVDVRAVALDRDRELHDSGSSSPAGV